MDADLLDRPEAEETSEHVNRLARQVAPLLSELSGLPSGVERIAAMLLDAPAHHRAAFVAALAPASPPVEVTDGR